MCGKKEMGHCSFITWSQIAFNLTTCAVTAWEVHTPGPYWYFIENLLAEDGKLHYILLY
jgi:hypothetical protein